MTVTRFTDYATGTFAFLSALTLSVMFVTTAGADDDSASKFYKERIEPVLQKNCYECHSHASGEASGKLMLDSMAAMTAGGTRGAAIVPGKPDDSWFIKAIAYTDNDLQMPPGGKLPDETIELLKKWVIDGAKGVPEGTSMVSASGIKRLMPEEATTHWAYNPPAHATITDANRLAQLASEARVDPSVVHRFTRSRIDNVMLSAQLTGGVAPSEAADRQTLARRLSYDLLGLPPSLELTRRVASDPRPDDIVIAELIDQLLASPRFGERFARYWMDVARYADTKGYVFREDRDYPQAYRYREWLISAFNDDLPYTEFVRRQLAADKYDPQNEKGQLPALGFLTLGRRFLNNKNDIIDDRLDVTARGLMGLTLACARCHDHKYDPISQADYYSMYGVFLNTEEPGGDPWPHRMTDSTENRKSFILIRGSPGNRGAEVPRKFVSFLSPEDKEFGEGSGRSELAARITSKDNPLTARVLVNRIWMRLMGTSLVDSPSDFGARCPPPRLQAVLDELAVDFIDHDWSMKHLVRSIVSSATYQQQSLATGRNLALDPENALYWHANRRRLDFESLRDSTLDVAGQLDASIGGTSEKIHERPFSRRRTVYAYIDRQNLPGVFRNFDVASPDAHSPQRLQTTVPQQGLFLLNSGFVTEMAHDIGQRLEKEVHSSDDRERVKRVFEMILHREPDEEETRAALMLVSQATGQSTPAPERWVCGYGEVDVEAGVVRSFNRLPFTNGKSWQGGSALPDPKLGWCMLNKEGGHPGADTSFAVIRRWYAPRDGIVSVRGKLNHRSDMGNGVRATVTSSRTGKHGQWEAKHQETRTVADSIEVKAGDAIDLVTDSLGEHSHDSFEWKVRIQYQAGGETFDSSRELPTERQPPLNNWEQLAQALMASNEFAFVD